MRKPRTSPPSRTAPPAPDRTPLPNDKKTRPPRAFSAQLAKAEPLPEDFQGPEQGPEEEGQEQAMPPEQDGPDRAGPALSGFVLRLSIGAAMLLAGLGFFLLAERLVTDLFARYQWLGWAGIGALVILLAGLVILAIGEIAALGSLKNLGNLRQQARLAIDSDLPEPARNVIRGLTRLYGKRADMARSLHTLSRRPEIQPGEQFDGSAIIASAEHHLMSRLDERARGLTAAAARRVAIVTAISPRAVIDLAFVTYESMKLARAIASLYGARPGFLGSWKLAGAILSHLAVTGGVALGDSVVQQMLGHGLAARLSARLGEGLVNGLMTTRVGIAAMKTTRPLPFDQLKQPRVMDFMSELARATAS